MAAYTELLQASMSNELKTKYEGVLEKLPARNKFLKKLTPKPMKGTTETYDFERSSRRGSGPSDKDGDYRSGIITEPIKGVLATMKYTGGEVIGSDTLELLKDSEATFWDNINGQVERLDNDLQTGITEDIIGKGYGIKCKITAIAGTSVTVDHPDFIAVDQKYDAYDGITFGPDTQTGNSFTVDAKDGNVLTVSAAGTMAAGHYIFLEDTRTASANKAINSLYQAASATETLDAISPVTYPEAGGIEYTNDSVPFEWAWTHIMRGLQKQRNNATGLKVTSILINGDNLPSLAQEGEAYRRFGDAKMQFGSKDDDLVLRFGDREIKHEVVENMPRDYAIGIPELTDKVISLKQRYPARLVKIGNEYFLPVYNVTTGHITAKKMIEMEWEFAIRYMQRNCFVLWNGIQCANPEYPVMV